MSMPRAQCPTCSQMMPVTPLGRLLSHDHRVVGTGYQAECPGSYMPVEVRDADR